MREKSARARFIIDCATYMSLMRICNFKCAESVGDFPVVICEVVGSLDKKVLNSTVDARIYIGRLYATVDCCTHRCRLLERRRRKVVTGAIENCCHLRNVVTCERINGIEDLSC